jgi:hypothetical protein
LFDEGFYPCIPPAVSSSYLFNNSMFLIPSFTNLFILLL